MRRAATMDRMTTLSAFPVTLAKRLRAHWPALIIPAIVAEEIALVLPHRSSSWATPLLAVVLVLAVATVALAPAAAAKAAPFVLFAYGFAGILIAHLLLIWRTFPLFYGVVNTRSASGSVNLLLPEAFAFMAAALWLLVVTGAPGGSAVRRAVHQLRGAGGEQKTVPALLLLPVLGLWEETFANPLWYGAGSVVWQLVGVALAGGGVVLVRRQPRTAAVVAVVGLIVLGFLLMIRALNGSDQFIYGQVGSDQVTARVDPRMSVQPGDTVKLGLDTRGLHFFDAESEKALI